MKTSNLLLKGFVRESNGCCFVYRSVSHMKQLPFVFASFASVFACFIWFGVCVCVELCCFAV